MSEDEGLTQFNALIKEFNKAVKRVLINRPLSRNKTKITEYIESLCVTYNNLATFSTKHKNLVSAGSSNKFSARIAKCKEYISKCGIKLNYSFEFSQDQGLIPYFISDDSELEFSDANSEPTISLTKTCSLPDKLDNLTVDFKAVAKGVNYTSSQEKFSSSNLSLNESSLFLQSEKKLIIVNMATPEQKRSFITLCASIIRNNYDGNPLGLESFIDKINLIEELTDGNLIPTLVRFIISKLEGKARESVSAGLTSVNEIKQSLRNRIKPDNSKVVAGKIISLRVINTDYAEFSKKVEELADSLERSLIAEGITQAKAHEMAVEQTVTVCRANAKTELVKSILASSSFTDPKDVVAKMVVEQSNEVAEKNVFRFNSNNNNPRYHNNNRGRANFHNNYSNNNRRNNNNNHSNEYRYNYQNHRHNNYQNNRGHNYRNNSANYNNNDDNNINNNDNNNNNRRNNYRQSSSNNAQNNNYQPRVRSLNVESHQEEIVPPADQ